MLKPLYEALPYLYLTLGMVTMGIVDSPVSFISGILFAAAGVVVWKMRHDRRRRTPIRVRNR